MTAKEMQIKYWEKELKDAERAINMAIEDTRQWEMAQKRYGNAERMLKEIRGGLAENHVV